MKSERERESVCVREWMAELVCIDVFVYAIGSVMFEPISERW